MSQGASPPTIPGAPVGVDASELFDPYFYGSFIASVLFGITIVQAWIYINTNSDRWPLRSLVGVLVVLDFVMTCLNAQILHHYLVANFGDLGIILIITTPIDVEYLLMLLMIFVVETFFAYRVWQLQKFHWIVPALIVLCAAGGAAAGIASTVGQFQNNLVIIFEGSKQKFEVGWNSSLSALSDIIATIALSWSFSSAKTGIKRTDTLLQKLLQYTVTRGLFVSIIQTLLVITFLVDPAKLWWTPFHLSLSKVYVITMIAMLNSRKALRAQANISVITDSGMGVQSEPGNSASYEQAEMHAMVSTRSKSKPIHKVILAPLKRGGNVENKSNDLSEDYMKHNGVHITQEQLPPQVI
ncbi:hypothetical protein K435DRAFT_972353 [Dendrothele bispora CBS 962.96]|uniref:DUF6534 domain-containing protein n=1 Tax=Dendrothele bispora (strain CBS 962.96) TaxID=1314807 RepID=A0A4S8KZP7_DENBC|nr:hypothetical protein K435DRAFT_972353 [Dendrothele bispora CBS 962.96]